MSTQGTLARRLLAMLAGLAVAVGVASCNRTADNQSTVDKAALEPTAPKIGPPPAQPAPVMPPKADAVFDQSTAQSGPASSSSTAGSTGDSGAKEPMTKAQESNAMPMPAQANDHSTTTTDKNDDSKK